MKIIKRKYLEIATILLASLCSVSVWAHPNHANENLSQELLQHMSGTSLLFILATSLIVLCVLASAVGIKLKSTKDDKR